ncbi:MAG TPA: solute carrier family 23 protein [Acidimicrobiales bacterium]|nr:solute carrier family 23 protein [Acidimicrobiales bacterium]
MDRAPVTNRTPIAQRRDTRGLNQIFAGVTRANFSGQFLAGITLLAIAIPEQLATSQLAGVPAFTAMIAFITASLVFFVIGSNPIVSVGADSTIAPLFAVALLRLAPASSAEYMELVAATAVVAGLIVMAIGLLKLGWLADFLSLPIVAGFMAGIGVIIITHQLPRVLGVPSGGESFLSRLQWISHQFGHVSTWSVVIALGTLVVMVVGEKINAKLPWALAGVLAATILTATASLASHGVQQLGAVSAGLPNWRLHWLSGSQWGVVCTTALTLVVVILSQSAATCRTTADDLAIADNISRDFVGIGLANVACGLVGAFPVNASPARTTVVKLAGGRTKLVLLVAGAGALVLSPFAKFAHMIPLAALAGVLLFVGGRLIKVAQFHKILAASRWEFALALISALGVVFIGVEQGLGIAVGLAILDQTWRSARPRMVELGRRTGTTSWEPEEEEGVERVDHILAVLFGEELFFANAGIFRRAMHDALAKFPETEHVIVDAVAISDIDYTGMAALAQVVADLDADKISFAFSRANDTVKRRLTKSTNAAIKTIALFDSTDAAAVAAEAAMKG